LPGREPFAPEATDAPQAPDEDVRPESAHTSVSVAFGFLLYVNANSTEFVVSVAPSAGDGETNVIGGPVAAAANAETMPTRATAATATTIALRTSRAIGS
jgi:hypothetical protein